MRHTNTSFTIRAAALLLALIANVGLMAQDKLNTLLLQFDKNADVATANLFFDQLLKEELIDEKTVFASETPADSLRQQVWYWAAEWMYDRQQYENAVSYGLKALPLFHDGNDAKADCLNLLGLVYVRMGDVKNAAKYAKQCLDIDMRSGDDDRISSSMNTLAGIYMAGYQAKEAEQYIIGAMEHAQNVDNPVRQAVIFGMASEIYHSLGDDKKALSYAKQAYAIDSMAQREPQASIRLSQMGSALLGLHQYKKAENIYRTVIPALKKVGDYHSYAIALNRLGMALLCQKRQREAIPCYKEAAALFSKMGDLYNEIHSHRGLYESYWNVNPDSAKIELDYFDLLKDSLYTHSSADALSRYNAEFGNDILQQENSEVRKKHQRTIIISALLILFIALAAWLIIRYLRRKQRAQMQELVQEIEKLRSSLNEPGQQMPDAADVTHTADVPEATADSNAGDEPETTETIENTEDRLFLMRVIETVNVAMRDGNLSVEKVASELNMSVQTFRRRLMAAAGESPKAYIQAIQMERATRLLIGNRDMPVAKIANLCGFDETSSFSHTFKRVYGCSPTQYREVDE